MLGLSLTRSQQLVRPQIATLARSESGTVLVEYALVMSFLSLVLIGGMWGIETATSTAYSHVTTELLFYAERNGS